MVPKLDGLMITRFCQLLPIFQRYVLSCISPLIFSQFFGFLYQNVENFKGFETNINFNWKNSIILHKPTWTPYCSTSRRWSRRWCSAFARWSYKSFRWNTTSEPTIEEVWWISEGSRRPPGSTLPWRACVPRIGGHRIAFGLCSRNNNF